MSTPRIVLSASLAVLGSAGCSEPEHPSMDASSLAMDAPTDGSPADGRRSRDANADAWDLPDSPPDAYWERPDAFRVPVESVYRNTTPPTCLDRAQPPRWLADNGSRPEGTLLWSVSLEEPRFAMWVSEQVELMWPQWIDAAPSLTGHGVATWYSHNEDVGRTWAIGLQGPVGVFANSGMVDLYGLPRMWLPRHDMLLGGNASGGRRLYAPAPEMYSPESSEDFNVTIVSSPGGRFWEGGARPSISLEGDMPAWSPVTGDFIAFGVLHDMTGERYRGASAFCEEGTRWFTQLPIYQGLTHAYVRPDGDVIVASRGEVWVLRGADGEMLRNATYVDDDGVSGWPSAYQPGCGVLLQYFERTWRWLDDETMTLGPAMELPADRLTNTGFWSGTADCGLVALGGTGPLYLTRLEADGSTRYSVEFRSREESGSAAGPPVALRDGGTLVVTNPFGWVRYSSTGAELSRVRLDASVVGAPTVQPALAPDGTLYAMGSVPPSDFRFFAAATGAVPGPFLWPNSGYNWARTNSVLPE